MKTKWGSIKVLAKGKGYKVVKIVIKPFKKLPIERHIQRDEVWILLESREIKIIERFNWHSINNMKSNRLTVLEIQIGNCQKADKELRRNGK